MKLKSVSVIKDDYLTCEELKKASDVIIRIIQEEEFSEEIKCLKQGNPITSNSKISSLNPFIDKSGILRVGGRLRNAEIAELQKYPILLPKGNFITNLIIKYYHEKHLHGGVQLLLFVLRQEFWIINSRIEIKKCVWKCVKGRFRAKTQSQLMGDLPTNRVIPSRIFSGTGADFTGPFLVKIKKGRGVRPTKCYVCIFICLATKAVHLELVGDLSSESFIAALKRFTARRGKPEEISTDCGTNFVGADRILMKEIPILNSSPEFRNWILAENIKWNFNPPSAPHHGGLWEAAVKSILKYHLRRMIGCQILTYEEFLTLITQVEGCLNSRPITPISNDPNELGALTPGYFLIGAPLIVVPERDLTSKKVTPLQRWFVNAANITGILETFVK
ncbi:uncharacterized protein LOC129234258 [Uloborus diversus]|uniref:uncharacterized protein LOC129234258 n=1 Tax=Uloborus diversus TaxID=327109 RepID=UPI00240A9BCD|nr:uncharacterized protein LOC129234258 [Uloborus diversus]